MKKTSRRKRKKFSCIKLICWIIIPIAMTTVLLLDGLEVYVFNTERLIVMGAYILVVLIPFYKEITIKNISLKRENRSK